jgi:predicted enzyme related to lactoylglutathione lyase
VKRCKDLGGTIVIEPRPMGAQGTFCVIKDPAGAVAALFSPTKNELT